MNSRPILYGPISKGLFVMPQSFGAKDEVNFAKRRMDTIRVAQYADSSCGLPNTYDADGAYLCGGRENGQSVACNKFDSADCLIRITEKIAKPNRSSCMYWEKSNAGDPEGKYCPEGRLDDKRIDFGSTVNPLGWGCLRCEYGQQILNKPDSEGRTRWCGKKGHPVEDNSCCAENEAIEYSTTGNQWADAAYKGIAR
jgi:hypothetical protein